VPDPNVSLVQDCAPLPVEVIVRGYITGVTKTSLWTLYEAGGQGERLAHFARFASKGPGQFDSGKSRGKIGHAGLLGLFFHPRGFSTTF
jgi:hypothetical protein